MNMAVGDSSVRSLEFTPTWALATVCFLIISVSILLEHSIYLLSNFLKRHRKSALIDAVARLKSELMLLGFVSLLLAVTQEHIAKICIPTRLADIMLPCPKQSDTLIASLQTYQHDDVTAFKSAMRNFSSFERFNFSDSGPAPPRFLADAEDDDDGDDAPATSNTTTADSCSAKGKVAVVTQEGLRQLSTFIFVLAVMQIVYSVFTMALGRAKMRRWKAWEKETHTTEYQVENDPNRFRFTRETTFGRRHTSNCTKTSVQLWIKCFFRQFFNSVAKVDYMTLRHGFISAHLSAQYKDFDFQKYIERSLDEDFKVVVSISPLMWFIVVIFMLLDVHGWNVYLWISYVPLLIVLVLGTKLEVVVARMALQLQNQNSVIIGTPVVEPNDDLFWFAAPRFVLTLLHITLFVNAFELAFFIWVTVQFGWGSCYHEHTAIIVTRVVLAVSVQVICSYITLPLYALVTQMGSEFKSNVLEKQVLEIVTKWHAEVRDKRRRQEQLFLQSPRTSLSADWSTRAGDEFSGHPQPTCPSPGGREITDEWGEIMEEQEEEIKSENTGVSSRKFSLEFPVLSRTDQDFNT